MYVQLALEKEAKEKEKEEKEEKEKCKLPISNLLQKTELENRICDSKTTMHQALHKLLDNKQHHLVMVNDKQEPEVMVTLTDILKFFAQCW